MERRGRTERPRRGAERPIGCAPHPPLVRRCCSLRQNGTAARGELCRDGVQRSSRAKTARQSRAGTARRDARMPPERAGRSPPASRVSVSGLDITRGHRVSAARGVAPTVVRPASPSGSALARRRPRSTRASARAFLRREPNRAAARARASRILGRKPETVSRRPGARRRAHAERPYPFLSTSTKACASGPAGRRRGCPRGPLPPRRRERGRQYLAKLLVDSTS